MPSPVGHALGGLIVELLAPPGADSPRAAASAAPPVEAQPIAAGSWPLPTRGAGAWLAVTAACLPDIDFLWGRHNLETHSVGMAVLVGLLVFGWQRSARVAIVCALAVLSHVLLDWLGSDDAAPLGVMALWPLSREFFFGEVFLFDAVSRQYWQPWFVRHNLMALVREVVLLGPLAAWLWWRPHRGGRKSRRGR
ncbi:MAG: metal-dependent hydrolase [Acidobacteriota bacterium]